MYTSNTVVSDSFPVTQEPNPQQRLKLDRGKYAVQLEWIADVASPAYTQLLKVANWSIARHAVDDANH